MKTFVFAYLGGMTASIPAFSMFNDVGASPWTNFDAVYAKTSGSLWSILLYFALLWIVPAFGSAFGAKIGGRHADFNYIYGRGIGGQVLFSIGFSLLMTFVPAISAAVLGLSTPMQTIVLLMVAQMGCTLGTVWGF